MAVKITGIVPGSPAAKAGIQPGDVLISINKNPIVDVLDYRFYMTDIHLELLLHNEAKELRTVLVRKGEYDDLGLEFETYLMDKQMGCRNKCIFCFVDQTPKGMRPSLYFKDDDTRMSFLFGNYTTLTNLKDGDIERIIKMHISPINISVHTTNPELRVKMMKNKNAGKVLSVIKRFNDAGIKINCQLVLCPGYNDGEELKRTLSDLTELQNAECIAAVPVGLTKYRDGLADLVPFNPRTAAETIDIIDRYGEECIKKYGSRRIYASDEFYLLAKRQMPDADYYGEFLQLENGVGLWALLLKEATDAIAEEEYKLEQKRKISVVTGVAAYPLITEIVDKCKQKWDNLECKVYKIKNNFFGEKITVAGLVTATDIKEQLKGENLGEELLIPAVMLRKEGDMFLDSITLNELSRDLGVKITPVDNDGYSLIDALLGKEL